MFPKVFPFVLTRESQKEYSHKQSRIVSNSLLALLHMTNLSYMEHPIIAFTGKQINFWISLSSINLFSTTICTISVKEWPHLDHWPLN